jgi:hypothetical protein
MLLITLNHASLGQPHNSPSSSITPQISYKTYPLIIAWIDQTYSNLPNQTVLSQIQSDMATLKSLGFTTILYWDTPLDEGLNDDNPNLYTMTTLLQVCQQEGLNVIFSFETWTASSPSLATHLQTLASYYKNYSNLIGVYFDDWYDYAGINREPADPVAFDDFVRVNFNIGRDYYTNYGFYDCLNSGKLVGKSLVSLCSDMYLTSEGAPDWSDPAGIQWLQNMYNTYNNASAYPYYTIGPIFDCSGEGGSDLHLAWGSQAIYCTQMNMLVYQWYCWKRPSGDMYGPGFWACPQWWPTVKRINQQILEYLQGTGLLGDLNGDGGVNMKDIALAARTYGSHCPNYDYQGEPASPNWNPNADINNDGVVNMKDIALVVRQFGQYL